jgi:hypothetical protein
MAAGVHSISGIDFLQVDPSGICDIIANQNTASIAISACYEGPGFTDIHPDIKNPSGKAGLGRNSNPPVTWRLPTLDDYKLAEVDGIPNVLPDISNQIRSNKISVRCVGKY